MARIFTWPTKSIIELADLLPIGDDATGLDKSASFANLINSMQLYDWIINKATTDAVLKFVKSNNGVDEKDIRLELTSTGLQLNLYDDSGVFISTVWEQVYSEGLYLNKVKKVLTVGDAGKILPQRNDADYSVYTLGNITPFLVRAKCSGTVRMYCQITAGSGTRIQALFRKNFVTLSTQERVNGGYIGVTYDMPFVTDDILEIYLRLDLGTVSPVGRYFRLYCDSSTEIDDTDYFVPLRVHGYNYIIAEL